MSGLGAGYCWLSPTRRAAIHGWAQSCPEVHYEALMLVRCITRSATYQPFPSVRTADAAWLLGVRRA